MLLKNVTQDIVFEKLEEMLRSHPEVCNCIRCRLDIAAIALNNLPPRYVVSDKGAALSRASGLDVQIAADTVRELTRALELVRSQPRHEVHNDNQQ